MKLVLSCAHRGPAVMFPGSGPHLPIASVYCTRLQKHTKHHWFSDDGTVEIRWEDDWSLDEGEWRREGDEE